MNPLFLGLIIGLFVGGILGVFAIALVSVNKDEKLSEAEWEAWEDWRKRNSGKYCNVLIGKNEKCEGLTYYDMGNMSSEEPTEFCKTCDLYEGRDE